MIKNSSSQSDVSDPENPASKNSNASYLNKRNISFGQNNHSGSNSPDYAKSRKIQKKLITPKKQDSHSILSISSTSYQNTHKIGCILDANLVQPKQSPSNFRDTNVSPNTICLKKHDSANKNSHDQDVNNEKLKPLFFLSVRKTSKTGKKVSYKIQTEKIGLKQKVHKKRFWLEKQ